MLQLEHAVDDRGRVSAGNPSLTSEKRRDITESRLRRLYQIALQREYRENEENALAGDGSIEDTTDMEQVVGIPLTGARIITRLRKLNPNLWFETANSDQSKTGVYILKNDFQGGQIKEHICGMETDMNPEFSLRIVDAEGHPKGIISGWRRLLMRLVRARHISETKAAVIFGPPSRESENWARFTS